MSGCALDLGSALSGCALPGRAPPPLELAAEARSAKQRNVPLPLEDPTMELKLRMSLEFSRESSEKHMYNAARALRSFSSDPGLSAAGQKIRDCLKEAAAQSGETAEELTAQCSKWCDARMNADDSVAMIELLRKAGAHRENLRNWIAAAQQSTETEEPGRIEAA